MLEMIIATYNEENEIESLITHMYSYADKINICDDGSTDSTIPKINRWVGKVVNPPKIISHTGLPETVKFEALKMCQPDSWVALLDADERYGENVRTQILRFMENVPEGVTHVWFTLEEYIDNQLTRTFQKCRLFKASAVKFSDAVHVDDQFEGNGAFYGWKVIHRKTAKKQIRRETEYIETYDKLVAEGKIDGNRRNELTAMHYFVK